MTQPRLSIHERLAELADATRCRLLLAVERQELTVGELCQALQLPQSTVSRHLKILADEAWVTSRADGASRWYRLSPSLDDEASALWALVRTPLRETPSAVQDVARLDAVLSARRSRSEAFFATASAEWDALRTTLFGARADVAATLALLDPAWIVGDLGCGTGALAAAFAPHVATVHAVDASAAMVSAAEARLERCPNVTVHRGTVEMLPLDDHSLDVAVMSLVLHHVADPMRALCEVARVLRPGGRLLITDMRAHTRVEYQQQMGHVWLGFDAPTLERWLSDAGFARMRYTPLPVDPEAEGPALFTAVSFTSSALKFHRG
ncbi:MAG: metalloregulator ArsR/SmtB family transcription factor [Gemmatimonadaceae bacterium]|nr:metalloregulator ArsR/SmtB family transcription factor [Gemmatimonadaceae bacterium]